MTSLNGTVRSLWQKQEAAKAVRRVLGVIRVGNQLQTRIPNEELRDDTDLSGDVREALMLGRRVPMTVDMEVRDGFVTLSGTASCGSVILFGTVGSWAAQDEAVAAAWSAPGVTAVDDRILVQY